MTGYLEKYSTKTRTKEAMHDIYLTPNIENMSAFPKVIYALNAIPLKLSYDFCGYCQGACQMHIRMQNTKNFQVNFKEGKKKLSGLYNHKLRSVLKNYNEDDA